MVLHRAAPLLTAAGGTADRGEEAAAAALRATWESNGSRVSGGVGRGVLNRVIYAGEDADRRSGNRWPR